MYTCKQAIVDLIAANGPQEPYELRRECETQAHDFSVAAFDSALQELQTEGVISRVPDVDYTAYDLTEETDQA